MTPPALWHALLRWSLPADRREDLDADLAEELAARAGEESPAAARRWYRRQTLGFVAARLQRQLRQQPPAGPGTAPRRTEMRERMLDWTRDLRHATRTLRRTPGFTATTVGILGLAIGANAAIFTVVDRILLRPLPYASADRLVHIGASAPGSDFPAEFGVAAEFFLHYKERSQLIEDVSPYNSATSTLRVGDRVERIRMSFPSGALFTTLGGRPLLGRLPSPDDENVAVISHALWTTWFAQDPNVVGQSHFISGQNRTIISVMPPAFRFPDDGTLLWVPSEIRAEGLVPGRFGSALVARMAPGATVDALAAELSALARELPERFGGSAAYARLIEQHRAIVRPLKDQLLGEVAGPLWLLLSAVAIVLLIACANVANLFTVRAEGRQRDMAVRRAIGAGRAQLVRLQLAEAVVLAAVAGGLAMALSLVSLPALLRVVPPGIPRLEDVSISPATLWFTLAIAGCAALVCGGGPALRASRPDFTRLREGGRGGTRRRHWGRDGLVVGQTALALVLLIGSGLLLKSFTALRHVDPGYDTTNVFTFQIAPDNAALTDGPSFARFSLDFMDRLRALPGVDTVGLIENVPLNEGTASAFFIGEAAAGEPDGGSLLQVTFAAGDYFTAMGIALVAGRPFDIDDHLSGRPHLIVSRSAAERLWPGEPAVGKRVQRQGLAEWYSVVGVVDDVMQDNFREDPKPLVYYPLSGPTPSSWALSSPAYVLKTARAGSIAPDVRAIVRDIAPEAPMYRVFTMAGLAEDSMVALSFTMLTLAIAASLALLLGAVGLYAVLSYIVADRTREIGVRMALGARAEQVRRMVVARGARVVAVGVGIGIAVALASTRALDSLLFGVAAVDGPTFLGMSVLMLAIGVLASYLPARRASNVDPIESLRGD